MKYIKSYFLCIFLKKKKIRLDLSSTKIIDIYTPVWKTGRIMLRGMASVRP